MWNLSVKKLEQHWRDLFFRDNEYSANNDNDGDETNYDQKAEEDFDDRLKHVLNEFFDLNLYSN